MLSIYIFIHLNSHLAVLRGLIHKRNSLFFRKEKKFAIKWYEAVLYTSMNWYFLWKGNKSELNILVFLCEKLRVLFTNWPKILCTGSFSEIRWLVTHVRASIIRSKNGNIYFECVSLLLEAIFDKIRMFVTLFACCFNSMKTKCFLSKRIRAYNFIQVRILNKSIHFWKSKIFHKNEISYPIYEQALLSSFNLLLSTEASKECTNKYMTVSGWLNR